MYQYPVRDEQRTSVHVWGKAEHGALGAYRQKKDKMKNRGDGRFQKFNRPLRLTFAEFHDVTDVAAGYGFSVFVVRSQGDKLFGSGINTDSQIGKHLPMEQIGRYVGRYHLAVSRKSAQGIEGVSKRIFFW